MSKFISVTLLLLASFMLTPAFAQDDDVTIVRSLTVSVKPGMNAQFEEFIRAFRDASQEQGLDNYWRSSQSVSGDPVYRFNSNLSGWGDVANPGPQLIEAFGEAEGGRLLGLFSDSVASMHTAFYQQRASMSQPPTNLDGPPEALIYVDFTLNPGGAAQFRELSTKTAEASAAVTPEAYFVGAMPDFGASGPRTILIVPSFSDLENSTPGPQQRVVRHFGQEEGSRINALAGEAIENISFTLFRTRPDLTYLPAN